MKAGQHAAATAAVLLPPGRISHLLAALVAALYVARLFMPTESAWLGNTLWLTQLWFAAGLLWAWDRLRRGAFHVRWGRLDTACGLIVLGHLVSAAAVFIGGGQKRAALNLSWEWLGLLAGLFLIRQTVATAQDARRMLAVMVVTAGTLAGLGLWQHLIFYPQAVAEYERVRTELDTVLQSGGSPARAAELQRELLAQGVPPSALDGSSRILFEDRLRASREPFGLFALANTFAGWLLVWLIVAAAAAADCWRQRPHSPRAYLPAAALVLVVAYCLLLTKSRTAWCGCAAGLMVWGLSTWYKSPRRPVARGRLLLAAGVGVTTIGLLMLAFTLGGLDRQVISEAPKSLAYRLEYWTGSWQVIQAHPWLGVGPGNFRQHYLRFKLPQSSEEIADPHNFLLDVWASGGLIGLLGMAGLIAVLFWPGRQNMPCHPEGEPDAETAVWHPPAIGAAFGFLLVLSRDWMETIDPGWRLPVLCGVWCLLWWSIGPALCRCRVSPHCLKAAAAGLLIHLLGAGGMEMPAIVQTLWLLPALAHVLRESPAVPAAAVESPSRFASAGAALIMLFMGCLFSATLPVLHRSALIRQAEWEWVQRGHRLRAEALLAEAAARDPFSPEPQRRLAEIAFQHWRSLPQNSDPEFQQAEKFARIAIANDPHAAHGYRTLGQFYAARFARTESNADARLAAEWMEQAVKRYPHSSQLRAEWAQALAAADRNRAAGREAAVALELEEINRRHGHVDKYLPPETVSRLKELRPAGGGNSSPRPDPPAEAN